MQKQKVVIFLTTSWSGTYVSPKTTTYFFLRGLFNKVSERHLIPLVEHNTFMAS